MLERSRFVTVSAKYYENFQACRRRFRCKGIPTFSCRISRPRKIFLVTLCLLALYFFFYIGYISSIENCIIKQMKTISNNQTFYQQLASKIQKEAKHVGNLNNENSKVSFHIIRKPPVLFVPPEENILNKSSPRIIQLLSSSAKPFSKERHPNILTQNLSLNITTNQNSHQNLTQTTSVLNGFTYSFYQKGYTNSSAHICSNRSDMVELLIIITSAVPHEEARMAIRQTWGHYTHRNNVVVAYIMGTTDNTTLKEKIQEENDLFGDIIIGTFLDSYLNLTLKTVFMLEWISNNCPDAKFVLKTDDDMFINVPRLLTFISSLNPNEKAFYGRLGRGLKPFRNPKSKYYVSPEEFRPRKYPDFTTGPAYLFPAKYSEMLFTASLNHPFFKLEDVFLTGMIAKEVRMKRINVYQFYNRNIKLTTCVVQKKISIHQITPSRQFDAWKMLLDGSKNCK